MTFRIDTEGSARSNVKYNIHCFGKRIVIWFLDGIVRPSVIRDNRFQSLSVVNTNGHPAGLVQSDRRMKHRY